MNENFQKQRYKTGQKALTRKEYEKLLSVCDYLEDRVFLMVAVSLGLRRSDIVRIKIDNIDFQNHKLKYLEKKKHDRIREVPMGPKLEQEIKLLINTIPKNQKTLFSFKDRQAYNRFQTLCQRAEIPNRPFHALRATCIKLCQAQGWTIEQTAELVGDSTKVIQEHYTTPSWSELTEVMVTKEVC